MSEPGVGYICKLLALDTLKALTVDVEALGAEHVALLSAVTHWRDWALGRKSRKSAADRALLDTIESLANDGEYPQCPHAARVAELEAALRDIAGRWEDDTEHSRSHGEDCGVVACVAKRALKGGG
jgi:hypothetical protein